MDTKNKAWVAMAICGGGWLDSRREWNRDFVNLDDNGGGFNIQGVDEVWFSL